MSSAPSKTGCLDLVVTNPHDKTEPATFMPPASSRAAEMTVHSADEAQPADSVAPTAGSPERRPTNLPLGVFDLTLSRYEGGPPVTRNRLPYYDERPFVFTVRLTNKPEGVDDVAVNLILSQLNRGGRKKGASGEFSRYDRTTTYKKTVPIVTDRRGHSIAIELAHAEAPSGGFHGGDGPYDLHLSFSPVVAGPSNIEADKRSAHVHDAEEHADDADEHAIYQTDEALRYTFYSSRSHRLTYFLDRFFMWSSRVWDGVLEHSNRSFMWFSRW